VLGEHFEAAINGATRSERGAQELGRIPFYRSVTDVLHRAHDTATSTGEYVELHHLREALTDPGRHESD